ncbi:hypothetical protein SDC9_151793 [bioreactor metagenome]|uniref:Uncharacterized protein n=1 Tax=bioreactor metagenome TaxID=1076179 RepID=A0A645ETK7_9ZZZZ
MGGSQIVDLDRLGVLKRLVGQKFVRRGGCLRPGAVVLCDNRVHIPRRARTHFLQKRHSTTIARGDSERRVCLKIDIGARKDLVLRRPGSCHTITPLIQNWW